MSEQYEKMEPMEAARGFAARHGRSGYRLDFSIASLETEIDRLLETSLFHRGRGMGTLEQDCNLAGLVAYVGETLRQVYDGRWEEGFVVRGDNFYTAFVQFGDYKYWPEEGTFAQHLKGLAAKLFGGTST